MDGLPSVAGVALTLAAFSPVAIAQEAKAPAKASATKAAAQKSFATPEEAVKALVEAVRAANAAGMLEVIGPQAKSLAVHGRQGVRCRTEWKNFLAAHDKKNAAEEGR